MKNVLYFTIKALFILKIFKSLSGHFGHVDGLNRKKRLILIINSRKQKIVIHILPNTSRIKDNQ